MHSVELEGRGDFGEWRNAARSLLMADIDPRDVDWRLASERGTLLGFEERRSIPPSDSGRAISVPAAFLPLAEAVICHSDPARFALLYRLLWRLQKDRSLLQIKADPDVLTARQLEKSVRRDSHKMTAFVRFKEVAGEGPAARRCFIAWFEPDHFIVERKAAFFQRRFTDMDWLIATPKGSARWHRAPGNG